MKKRKFLLFAAAIAAFLFVACSSSPNAVEVETAQILGKNAMAYFSIPVHQNRAFTEKAVLSLMGGTNKKDADRIISRLENVAMSISDDGNWELASTGNFPTTLSKFVLTQKNGWTKTEKDKNLYYENKDGLTLSFISSEFAAVSSSSAKTEKLVSRFSNFQSGIGKSEDSLSDEAESFLLEREADSGEIRFFVPNASSFFSAFFGIPLGVETVCGILTQIENKEAFDAKLEIEFGSSLYYLAFSALAKNMGISVEKNENGNALVSGFEIEWDSFFQAVFF